MESTASVGLTEDVCNLSPELGNEYSLSTYYIIVYVYYGFFSASIFEFERSPLLQLAKMSSAVAPKRSRTLPQLSKAGRTSSEKTGDPSGSGGAE